MILYKSNIKPNKHESYQLPKKKWINKGYHGVVFFHSSFLRLALEKVPYFKSQHRFIIDIIGNEKGFWYWNYEDMVAMRNELLKKVNKNAKFLSQFVTEWRNRLLTLKNIIKQIDSTNLAKLTDKQLALLFEKLDVAYMRQGALSFSVQDSFSMTSEEFLVPHFKDIFLKKGLQEKSSEMLELLTSPVKDSFLLKERKGLLAIAASIKNLKNPTATEIKKLEQYSKKYFWIENNYARTVILNKDYFLNKVRSLSKSAINKELHSINTRSKNIRKIKKQLVSKLKLSKESKNLIKITEVFAYMQDERKRYSLIVLSRQQRFLEEFAKRLHLTLGEAKSLNVYEILNLITRKTYITKQELKQRSKLCILISANGNALYQLTDEEAVAFQKQLSQKIESQDSIQGMVASKGVAQGKVCIVYTVQDLLKMQKGNILVTSMTRPEMVSAMHLASAIVTDEGGITSHAAVVSRELGIPCVIGTKVATKVFKDGDVVEVDANKGVVRKI